MVLIMTVLVTEDGKILWGKQAGEKDPTMNSDFETWYATIKTQRSPMISVNGNLEVVNRMAGLLSGFTMDIKEIEMSIETPATGSDIKLDFVKGIFNVSTLVYDYSTLYTTTENKPVIPATKNKPTTISLPDIVRINKGEIFAIDVLQIGSTDPGKDLMLTLICEEVKGV